MLIFGYFEISNDFIPIANLMPRKPRLQQNEGTCLNMHCNWRAGLLQQRCHFWHVAPPIQGRKRPAAILLNCCFDFKQFDVYYQDVVKSGVKQAADSV